jgi:hypothetical protein
MLDVAIHRYGGEALWRKLDYVLLDIESIRGPLPAIKGIGRTFPHFGRIQVFPKQFRAVFHGCEGSLLGEFDAGRVHCGDPVAAGDYRSNFNGLGKHRNWNAQDAMYFFGYALTVYLSVPFLLPSLAHQTHPWKHGGLRVDAIFPEKIHSHCREQSFYFDKDGLLVRHDYTADIVSGFAFGAHFTSNYEEVDGLPIARERRVFARLGNLATFIPVLSATLRPVKVGFNEK